MQALGYNADASGKGTIAGPLAQFGSDPTSFILGFVSAYRKTVISALQRVARRTGHRHWTVTGSRGKKYTMQLLPQAGDASAALAMKLVAQFHHNARVMGDELVRVASGQPIGKNLDGIDFTMPDDAMMQRWNLFGVDDAIVISVAVPAIVGLIGVLLPILVDMVGGMMDAKQTPKAIAEGTAPPPAIAPPGDDDDKPRKPRSVPWALIGALVVVGAAGVYAYRSAA